MAKTAHPRVRYLQAKVAQFPSLVAVSTHFDRMTTQTYTRKFAQHDALDIPFAQGEVLVRLASGAVFIMSSARECRQFAEQVCAPDDTDCSRRRKWCSDADRRHLPP